MPRRNKTEAAFSAALNEHLERRSMTKADLARATGVSPTYISRMANGAVSPSSAWVDKISTATSANFTEHSVLQAAAANQLGYGSRMPNLGAYNVLSWQAEIAWRDARIAELEKQLKEKSNVLL